MRIKIEGVAGFDGDYGLDPEEQPFKNSELRIIKQQAGVRAGELNDALAAGDNDVFVALAYIAVLRSGKRVPNADALWDAEIGKITIIGDEGVDADPPVQQPSVTGAGDTSSVGTPTSGDGS